MNELIPSVSIENLLSQRDAMIERFKKMQDLALELHTLQLTLGSHYAPSFLWESRGHRESLLSYDRSEEGTKATSAETYTKAIDALAWKFLMEKSGNLTYMDATARKEWSSNLSEGKFPELTYENIAATFRDLHASRKDMFHRSIIKVFQNLSWDYKTNQPFRFGKRVIIGYVTGTHGQDKLDDLTRAFCVLDGKPEPDYRQGFNSLVKARDYSPSVGSVETEYLTLKWFKNGNGHATFKRLDLVEKMNKILHIYYPNAIASEVREAA